MNFNCDNLIIILYPMGAGGKFLANCLGLSSDVVLMDEKYLDMQLNGNLDIDKKISLISEKIKTTSNYKWEEFKLDSTSFLGSLPEKIDFAPKEYIEELRKNKILIKLTGEHKKYFFILPHHYPTFLKQKKIWPNSKSIIFKNSLLFTLIRNCHQSFGQYVWNKLREQYFEDMDLIGPNENNWRMLPKKIHIHLKEILKTDIREEYQKKTFNYIWSKIREDKWPKNPPKSISEYLKYDICLREEIERTFNLNQNYSFHDFENYDSEILEMSDFLWDTNWYFCKSKTILNIKKLYDFLKISDYNEDYISQLYDLWISKNNEITINSRS